VGKPRRFTVLRNGEKVELRVKTEKRDENSGNDTSNLWPGINIVPLNNQIREQLSLGKKDDGVVIAAIAPDSIAGGSGLQQGDLVISINSEEITSARDFYRALNSPAEEIQFRVLRNGRELTIGFTKPEK
jgi:serine protease Do